MASKNNHQITMLGEDNLPDLLALSQEAGWSHTERDWKAMVSTGTTFGYRSQDEQKLSACIHMTEYGTTFATLGMLIVSKPYQKQGLAKSLVHQLMAHNKPKHRSIGLITANPAQSFYPPFGFQPTGEHILKLTRKNGRGLDADFSADNYKVSPILSRDDIDEVSAFDENTSKMNRSFLIEHLLKANDRSVMVHDASFPNNPVLVGFGSAKCQGSLLNLGPIVSLEQSAALAICQTLAEDHDGPIRMDTYDSKRDYAEQAMQMLGFQQEDKQAVMMNTFGDENGHLPGNRHVMFCPASQAWL